MCTSCYLIEVPVVIECDCDYVIGAGERRKGSGDLAFRSPVVEKKDEARPVVGVGASSFFQCFDTVGWVTGGEVSRV